MAGKRKHVDALPTSINLPVELPHQHPQKRRRLQGVPANRTYSASQCRDFKASVSKITDWRSNTIAAKHIQIIYWIDVENLNRAECAARYLTHDGRPCSTANIWKMYKTYAPRFYAEKNVAYVPLGQRGAHATKKTERMMAKEAEKKAEKKSLRAIGPRGKMSRVDVELKHAFAKLSEHTAPSLTTSTPPAPFTTCRHRLPPIVLSSTSSVVIFLCQRDGITHGTSGPSIPISALAHHSTAFGAALSANPNILTVRHGPEVSLDTISRFAACITPSLALSLPSHVQTPYGVCEQTWTPNQLEDLYVLAVSLGASAVCDLVLDRWTEEVRRVEARMAVDEWDEVVEFDVLGFGPELMSFLLQNDGRGFRFFASILVSRGREGWERMKGVGLEYWSEETKKGVLGMVQEGRWVDVQNASHDEVCAAFHHHGLEFDGHTARPTSWEQPVKTTRLSTTRTRTSSADESDSDSDPGIIFTLQIPTFPQIPRHDYINNDPIYSTAFTYKTDGLRQHKGDHLIERMQYANPKFNAHHDTAEICVEKVRLVRKKLVLFKERDGDGLDQEIERLLMMEEDEDEGIHNEADDAENL